MAGLLTVLGLTLAAGLAIPLGGFLAHIEHLRKGHLRDDLLLSVIGFGGGALLSAVVLVLVPEGLAKGDAVVVVPAFVVGSVGALLLGRWLESTGTNASQPMAMLLDFVPESLALGAAAATRSDAALFLALLIGLQNLPEGFASYRQLCTGRTPAWGRTVGLGVLAGLSLLGPLAGLVGYQIIVGRPNMQATVLMFASGGILALVFQDIAPAAHRRLHIVPTLGMVLGFTLGIVGHLTLL